MESVKTALANERKARKEAEMKLKEKCLELEAVKQELRATQGLKKAKHTPPVQEIQKFVRQLSKLPTIDEVCLQLTSCLVRTLKIEECGVFLVDAKSQDLTLKAFQSRLEGYPENYVSPSFSMGEGLVGQVATTGESILTKIDQELKSGFEGCSQLAIPFLVDEAVVGVLLCNQPGKEYFDEHNMSFCSLLAELTSLKIGFFLSSHPQKETPSEDDEVKFKKIVEGANEIIFELNAQGYFTYINPTSFRRMKYEEEELKEMHFTQLVAESHRSQVNQFYIEQILKKSTGAAIEFPAITKDGKVIWINQHTKFEYNNKGHFVSAITVARDITRQKQYEKTLQIQQEKYRSIINNMNLGLLEVDLNDHVVFANRSFLKMSGYSESEILHKKAGELFMTEENISLIKDKIRLRNSGLSDIYTLPARNKSGEERWWLISGAPNYNDQGEVIGSIGIHLDLTEQKKLEAQLAEALIKSEDSAKAKELFLANMSHEIRTPLNAIIGILNEFPKINLDSEQSELLFNVQHSAQHLLSIVNNILDLTKIASGEFLLNKNQFKPSQILGDIYSIFILQASQKKLDLSIYSEIPNENEYFADASRIRQILVNLIGNSVKFTQEGSIKLQARILDRQEHNHKISFVVEDTGIGMNKEYLAKLFSKFTQEDGSITKNYGGTGLGMALTYEIIQLMGGSIDVKSEKNKGTRIEVILPIEFTKECHNSNTQSDLAPKNLVNANILLVEDNEINRLVVRMTLKPFHCQITEAENGQIALDYLQKESFDLILMDLQMPVMDGFETTIAIRNKLKLKTPIIALTANAMKNTIDKCLAIGMNSFVIKPFAKKTMLQELSNQIRQNEVPPSEIE